MPERRVNSFTLLERRDLAKLRTRSRPLEGAPSSPRASSTVDLGHLEQGRFVVVPIGRPLFPAESRLPTCAGITEGHCHAHACRSSPSSEADDPRWNGVVLSKGAGSVDPEEGAKLPHSGASHGRAPVHFTVTLGALPRARGHPRVVVIWRERPGDRQTACNTE